MCATAWVKAGSLVKTKTPGIFKKNNRYVVVFRDTSGRQRKRFARTLAEARDLKAVLTADVRRGEYRTLSKISFEDYATEWIEQYGGRTKRGLREATRDDYRRRCSISGRSPSSVGCDWQRSNPETSSATPPRLPLRESRLTPCVSRSPR